MEKTLRSSREICLFDSLSLTVVPELKYHADGLPGSRVLFITDAKESFTVSFEEGLYLLDVLSVSRESANEISYQSFVDGKYICQKRNGSGNTSYAFFQIELEDGTEKLYLPGQLVVTDKYVWSDGVEPVLMKLLEGINLCKTKGGGSD